MSRLTSLINIGAEMERKLTVIGLDTVEKLRNVGAKEAYFRLKVSYPEICLVHLYVLRGAIDNIPYHALPTEVKADLKAYSDKLKKS